MNKWLLFTIPALIIVISFPRSTSKTDFPVFRVVIDPGHGGLFNGDREKHGDRYDVLSGQYLAHFSPGVRYRGIEEHEIMYSISLKVKKILDYSLRGRDFIKFKSIIERFTDDTPGRIIIKSKLSREDSRNREAISSRDDPNAKFRLYDYPDKNGNVIPGRISKINAFKPHLLVSLHCDYRPPVYYRGINPVITAPFSILHKGLQYLKGEIKNGDFFYNSRYADWFVESIKRTGFKWFLKDTSVYFTGYPVDNSCRIRTDKFSGYRRNMVKWVYRDLHGWELLARRHPSESRWASSFEDFEMRGRFWDRERSKYESYRRENGEEGYGGDNLYACREIIRYILYSLDLNKIRHRSQKLGHPYISVWSVPLLVNAVTAYIELGYLYRKRDRYLMTVKQDEIAEGIAVGIYSLLAGLKPAKNAFKYLPKGKRVDLEKYLITTEKDYFSSVVK